MKTINVRSLLGLLLLFSACTGKQTTDSDEAGYVNILKDCPVVAQYKMIGNDSVLVCDINAMKDEIEVPFSSLLSSYEIVPLDTCRESLCAPKYGEVTVSKNYLCVISGEENSPVRLFDRKTGKYLRQIGNIGQGPTEYTTIYQIQIEEDSNRVFILSGFPSRVLQYNLSTGEYEKNYKLLFKSAKKVYCDVKAGEIIVLGFPRPNYPAETYCFWKQTFDGELIQGLSGNEQLGCSYHNRGSGYIDDRSNSYQVSLWDTTEIKQDTLYHYDLKENRLVPRFTVEWIDKVPTHYYIELSHYYYCETSDKNNFQYLIHKRTGKGAKIKLKMDIFEKDSDLGNLRYMNYNSYGVTCLFDPVQLADILQQKNQQKTIAGKMMDPDSLENENSWVFIGKWN